MAYTTIDDPSAYFQTALWTGNNTTQAITNDGNSDLQPDLVWLKMRSSEANQSHRWTDSTRGVTKSLESDDNDTELTEASGLTAFNSDGFTLGGAGGYNGSGRTYVGWQWKANGGTTSSNTDGSVTSTVQANTTAGFSIVTYTATGSGDITVGHGLGAVPKVIIGKVRNQTYSWRVYHESIGNANTLILNLTNASSATNAWGDTNPTSSVFTAGRGADDNMNFGSGDTIVAYCFAEKQGYSKFGSYTGNGNADGAFVYTGFKPAFLILKNTADIADWTVWDTTRYPTNPQNIQLYPNLNNPEDTHSASTIIDFLSNGFKLRGTNNKVNGSSDSIIYMAFAEHPFVSSTGTPTTAR